jgi:two-component system, OmpR family, sensor histidine kinase QseC
MIRIPRPKSLQARLLVMLLGVVAVVWMGAALLTWVDARHELDELLDGHLAQAAALLVVQQTQALHDDDDGVVDGPSLHKYAPRVAFQVFHEGHLVMRSSNAAAKPMSSRDEGFSSESFADGTRWRVFTTRGSDNDVQVYVAEQIASRSAILWAVLWSMLLPLAIALPLLALALWWAVRQGLAPLHQLSRLLGARQAQALSPVVLMDSPIEIQPLIDALNALFERIDSMMASERRFTADAAHELRTPIAAIRAQAQVALGAGADLAQRDHALQATLAGCDRATRLVEQLLTLARLESASSPDRAPVNLTAVTRRVAADLGHGALARRQTLELDAPDAAFIQADEVLTGVLVRNLIDNALRYSPAGAHVNVRVRTLAGETHLTVDDSGSGLSDAEMARLGERFYRVLGHTQTGSGLGWSIVKRIAQAFGAQIDVSRSASLGGLSVAVRWPTASPG